MLAYHGYDREIALLAMHIRRKAQAGWLQQQWLQQQQFENNRCNERSDGRTRQSQGHIARDTDVTMVCRRIRERTFMIRGWPGHGDNPVCDVCEIQIELIILKSLLVLRDKSCKRAAGSWLKTGPAVHSRLEPAHMPYKSKHALRMMLAMNTGLCTCALIACAH